MTKERLFPPAQTPPRFGGFDLCGLRRAGLGDAEGILAAATVFLAPINYLRLEGVYLTASDLAAVMCLVVMMANKTVSMRFFGPATTLWLTSVFLLIAGLFMGSLVNGEPSGLLVVFLQYGFSLLLLPLVLAGRSYAQSVALIQIFVLSVTLIMIHGIWLIEIVESTNPSFVSGTGRLRSLIERENESAAIVAIAMTFALGLTLSRDLPVRSLCLALPFLVYGLLLTGSNTGLMLSTLGLVAVIALIGSAKSVLITGLVVGAGVAAIFVAGYEVLPETFQKRVLTAMLEGDINQAGTFSGRLELIKEAMMIARDTWLIGLGAEQYRMVSEFRAPVHNAYLLLLTEGSAVSLFGMTGLLLTGTYLAWAARVFGHAREVSVVTIVIVLIFATMLMMVPHFYARFWNVPLVLALSLSASRISDRRVSRPWPALAQV